MNIKKKIMAVLLAVTLVAGAVVNPVGMETVRAVEAGSEWYYEGGGLAGYSGKDTDVRIPDGTVVLGYYSGNMKYWIDGLENVEKITIPSSVTNIYDIAFYKCTSLKEIVVEADNAHYASDNGVLFSKDKTTLLYYPKAKEGGYIIPSGVVSIEGGAFTNCKSLASISIPSGVTSIESNAFWGCISLTSINIPFGVTSIGFSAFRDCTGLTSVSIPSSVTSIRDSTFYGCKNLISISIPSGVTSIGVVAFAGCESLTSVSIPSSVISIGGDAFYNCSSLRDVFYDGSQEQWNQQWDAISEYDKEQYKTLNNYLGLGESVVIHYNSTEQGNPDQPQETPENSQKPTQKITAKNITKTYGAKAFSLNAKVNTGAKLTYAVSDKKVATVDKKGKVTIKGCGITNITITAATTGDYKKTTKTIKLTVKPKKATLSSVKSTKKKTAAVKWKRNKEATGYIIQCATDSKFKKNKVQTTIGKNKTISATVKKLKAGKKYYVRVCAYKKSGKTKVQGDWSKVKTVKVKK